MKRSIGIDAIAIAAPQGFIDIVDLAEARGVPPGKYLEGLGVRRMAVAQPWEDPVALAANAGARLLSSPGVDRSKIGLCIVGSETAVDHSKPIAAFLHRLLELPAQARVYETKHACFGGTAGLMTALDWIASGASRGRCALVICTDIARYELRSAGEPTQGAGAVAMLIKENPRLVEIDNSTSGSWSADVDDFWRPLDRKEALVDGQHSVQCYLDALGGAYAEWKKAEHDAGNGAPQAELIRRVYHVPYGKMSRKAHRHIRGLDGLSEAEADASFAEEVATSLKLPSEVGNVYTGSLYLALASLLHFEAPALEGKKIGLFSYGSGCTAEFFSARVLAGAAALCEALQLAAPLESRKRYTIHEYEAIRAGDAQADRTWKGEGDSRAGQFVYVGLEADARRYQRRG